MIFHGLTDIKNQEVTVYFRAILSNIDLYRQIYRHFCKMFTTSIRQHRLQGQEKSR